MLGVTGKLPAVDEGGPAVGLAALPGVEVATGPPTVVVADGGEPSSAIDDDDDDYDDELFAEAAVPSDRFVSEEHAISNALTITAGRYFMRTFYPI